MKLGIIATQIADDGDGPSVFFDELGPLPAARLETEKLGRVSGTFARPVPSRATTSRPARKVPAKATRRRA